MFKAFIEKTARGASNGRHSAPPSSKPLELISDAGTAKAPVLREKTNAATKTSERENAPVHPIIGILGAKGGVGATTLAINLAAAIAREHDSTLLIDANLQHPDAALIVGRKLDFTLLDMVDRADELTPEIFQACSVPISNLISACRLISPPADGEAAIKTSLSIMADCVHRMRACSPFWLIDLPKHLDRHLVTLMDKCDLILLVTEPTITSIAAAKRWAAVFDDLGYPADKVCWTLNRCGGKTQLVEDSLQQLLPLADAFRLPNAFELSERSVTRGEPVVAAQPRSALSMAISKLAKVTVARFTDV